MSFLAKKFRRSPAAIRQRLSRLGLSAKVPLPNYLNLHQVSKMLGVSDSIVRVWLEKGLFEPHGKVKGNGSGQSKVLIHESALVAFCVAHPDKVNSTRCHPDIIEWLDESEKHPTAWNGSCQHLAARKECPRCGRVVVGNAYGRHVKKCEGVVSLGVREVGRSGHPSQVPSGSNG